MKAIERIIRQDMFRAVAKGTVFTLVMLISMVGQAADKTAHQVAEEVKNDMVALIADRENIEKKGEGAYFDAVQDLFAPVVNFEYIANGVMGEFSKKATDEQKQKFAGVFQHSLMSTISTWAQGQTNTSDYKIEVVPPKGDVSGKKSVNVGLEVHSSGSVNRLAFTMRLNKDEQWKIANVTLNGINLGITFRAQFAQSVKKADGDIDAAIASWSA